MTDRELLELAAKAAGIELIQWVGKGCWSDEGDEEGFQTTQEMDRWNPLTDDGDAFQLAVKLQLLINVDKYRTKATDGVTAEQVEESDNDPYAATRRAIVRAAAEIGKVMR